MGYKNNNNRMVTSARGRRPQLSSSSLLSSSSSFNTNHHHHHHHLLNNKIPQKGRGELLLLNQHQRDKEVVSLNNLRGGGEGVGVDFVGISILLILFFMAECVDDMMLYVGQMALLYVFKISEESGYKLGEENTLLYVGTITLLTLLILAEQSENNTGIVSRNSLLVCVPCLVTRWIESYRHKRMS